MAVSNPEEELNVRFDPDLGPKFPVAAVANKGKQVVSDDSSATVIDEAVVPVGVANDNTPAPSVTRACPLLPTLVGNVATLVPLEVTETNPLPLLNIPVSVSVVNVIEGTAADPSGNVPPALT